MSGQERPRRPSRVHRQQVGPALPGLLVDGRVQGPLVDHVPYVKVPEPRHQFLLERLHAALRFLLDLHQERRMQRVVEVAGVIGMHQHIVRMGGPQQQDDRFGRGV